MRLVVVEDLQDTRALVARILAEEGAVVREAASATEALELIAAERPDVLISDIGMPTADGYQFIRTLRARESSCERIPAIALTAFVRTEDRSEALDAGFQLHLGKPVNREALLTAVASLLKKGPGSAAGGREGLS